MPPIFSGETTATEARLLASTGKDANQISNILFKKDPAGRNYGIGIILDGKGHPEKSSRALLRAANGGLDQSHEGSYMNSSSSLDALKEAVLAWQQVPEKLWGDFVLCAPSDAGTGAVKAAIESALLLSEKSLALGIEELSWPAYKTIAKVLRIGTKGFPLAGIAPGRGVLPVYQAGPHNSTGRLLSQSEVEDRAAAAKGWVVLDRAYSGFEYASTLSKTSYDAVMKRSFKTQISPFLAKRVPFLLAISPTKAFITFALRPCGFLLAYCPDPKTKVQVQSVFNAVTRARGSAFEHPVSRAFIHAMTHDMKGLKADHERALKRTAVAEASWKKLVKGTALEAAFSGKFAGLFRNLRVTEGADAALYQKNLYPVFTPGRCRLNITGLPDTVKIAKEDAAAFSEHCIGV